MSQDTIGMIAYKKTKLKQEKVTKCEKEFIHQSSRDLDIVYLLFDETNPNPVSSWNVMFIIIDGIYKDIIEGKYD